MGTYRVDKCIFTDLPVKNIHSELDGIEYSLRVNKQDIKISLPYDATSWDHDSSFFKKNKYLLAGLLYNNIWVKNLDKIIELQDLEKLIQDSYYPKSAQEKADNLLLGLFKMQTEEGESIDINELFLQKKEWRRFFFKSYSEANFYLKHLQSKNLIDTSTNSHYELGTVVTAATVSFNGLAYIIHLQENGENSKNCFIAMAFSSETIQIRDAIKTAVSNCGYVPIIIDEQHVQSDKTINDEIIASLKRCKFCIADFTLHRNGVYFESGFALGQGKKVIYTCRQDEFSKAHFDIRPLQHIIYSTADELIKALTFKIQAFID
jgi:hypothetical protein